MPSNPLRQSDQDALRGKRADQLSAALWIGVGIIVIQQAESLDYMGEYAPGPGFLLFWLGVVTIALALTLVVRATLDLGGETRLAIPSAHAARQMLLVATVLFAFAFLADKVGFLVCIALMFLFLLLVVEKREWRFSFITALVSACAFWLVFELLLQVRFPPGLLALLR